MIEHGLLGDILILLTAAVIVVPIAHRLGLGAVLGYLGAGLLVGPWGLDLLSKTEDLSHVSELGVVFLLFVIGLELEPKRLWSLRYQLLGLGTAQMLLVAVLVFVASLVFGLSPAAAGVVGIGAALSSTAIVVQILKDRNLFATKTGQSAFAVLLFQDIAVIPILALLPLLATQTSSTTSPVSIPSLLLAIAGVVLAGRYLLRPLFRLIASSHLREIFTALCLLFVMGLAALMHSIGASMALGAFLGGILLANSEYRHAIETDIEPFKGLLLGLFFISVGSSIDVGTIVQNPLTVIAWTLVMVLLKFIAHLLLAKPAGLTSREVPFFALILSQVGEFAFVLYALAATLGILTAEEKVLLSAAVALSMVTTPFLGVLYDRFWAPRLNRKARPDEGPIENDHPAVIIAGFGRVGQIIGRVLYANRIKATVLDHDPDQIELLRRFGFKIYYGDATRLDLLHAAGAREAKVLVVAIDDVENSLKLVDLAREHFPHLQIVARASNVGHAYDLMDRQVEIFERETFESSLRLGGEVLKLLGFKPYQAARSTHIFRAHNLEMLDSLHSKRKNQAQLVSDAKQARDDLEQMFAQDSDFIHRQRAGWDAGPLNRPDETGK